ncbi:MAG TPA: bifunctional diaminohydroxyphosphoribosylaminopyrimidine deaminase/5-amino-6-(5-phosphoribosylamino)uracil reductase RibD [Steroidobacteraceae bacterium]|nr:bifunctional diaminohydroxyphosphoribosylaminopyrimidine deaminase/5-amino-6-(5-phosphoribosylamino)uracil reductase RibD [Steroidobacteraceae bacterium]
MTHRSFSARDRAAMSRALELAARGLNTTHPNPRVGCVIVEGDRTVGEGWHERPGEPHAEIMALRAAGARAAGGTAYVTLEPCCHFGRTPPCADALIEARLGRVVFALEDPNPDVRGKGAERLRAAGIAVESGLMQHEAAELNAGFIKRMTEGRPWLRVKLAMSLDGRTALANGKSQWITGEAARADVQVFRARSSALLTGVGTVLADDPRLDVRLEAARARQPLRVVLDWGLRTPARARLFESAGEVWIFTASADAARRAMLEARGARIECLEEDAARAAGPAPGRDATGDTGRLDLHRVLGRLAQAEVNEVQVEAGATLAGELIRRHLADELLVYVAPVLLGPQARPLVELPRLEALGGAPRFELIESQPVGADLRMRLRAARGAAAA